ncbi:MAG: hypothetical protein ACYDBV_10715 [Nitrospiria bacterium]
MTKNLKVKYCFFNSKALVFFFFLISLFNLSVGSIAGSSEPEKDLRVAQLSQQPYTNHDSTSFPLLGAHRSLECFKCHSGGRYKGTPRTCETCHNGQITYGKPAGHLMTTQSCLVCHNVNAWSPSNFIHDPSTAGQCSNCHNGRTATGKPSNHVNTTSQCDTCHSTRAWTPAGFNHANIGSLLCSSCHHSGGSGLPPKSDSLHNLPGRPDCRQCHSSTTTFSIWTMNHTGISPPTPCANCHIAGNSMGAVSTPNPHPYAASNSDCSQCHTNFSTFAGAIFSHTGITGNCSSCHKNPATGVTGPRNDTLHRLSILPDCSQCHTSTTSFSSWTMNHTGISPPTACMTCHVPGNNMGALYKPSGHPVTTQDCGSCHSTTTFSN